MVVSALAGATGLGWLAHYCSRREEAYDQDLVLLDVADEQGRLLSFAQMRQLQSNGAGQEGGDDELLEATTLEVVTHAPLQADGTGLGATACLHVPAGREVALALSWPTSDGYSTLLADIPGPGRHSLGELAARSLHTRQTDRLQQLQEVDPEEAARVTALRQVTQAELEACARAASPAQRATCGGQALEAASQAQLALDRACSVLAPPGACLGVTLTRPPTQAETASLSALDPGRPLAARLVIDDPLDQAQMGRWRQTLTTLHAQGVSVLVQVCDSQTLAELDDDAWDQRLDALVSSLSEADAWETGNELGGSWLGPRAVERATQAARLLSSHPATAHATRVLTLYYQLGQDTEQSSVLTWAHQEVTEELSRLTDVVGLSVYPQWHPLGTAADRVLGALALAFPGKRLAVTELGYGGADLDEGPWWFGSGSDPAAGRAMVAEHVTSAALGRAEAWGAPFWWYYLEDEATGASGGQVSPYLRSAAGGQD